jgi:hypothetical protein
MNADNGFIISDNMIGNDHLASTVSFSQHLAQSQLVSFPILRIVADQEASWQQEHRCIPRFRVVAVAGLSPRLSARLGCLRAAGLEVLSDLRADIAIS